MSERLRGMTARDAGLASCHVCGHLEQVEESRCSRCQASVHSRKQNSLQRCIALSFAGAIAYIPANIMPIMWVTSFGDRAPRTIMTGIISFWEIEAYPIAITIFVASVIIPGLKLIALGLLCAAASGRLALSGKFTNIMFFLTELIGRWSMIDVFVVAILAGLVQLGGVATIEVGPAAVAFGLTVILTMIAAHSFDPRLVWDQLRTQTQGAEKSSF